MNIKIDKQKIKLVQEGLELAKDYLPKLLRGIDDIIDKLETEEQQKAFNMLADAAEGIQWYLNNLIIMDEFISSNIKEEYQLIPMDSYLNNINQLLTRLVDTMNRKDSILLIDLLDYELRPIIEDWNEINNKLFLALVG